MPPKKPDIDEDVVGESEDVSDEQVQSTAIDLIQGVVKLEDVPIPVRQRVTALVTDRLKLNEEPSREEIVRYCNGIRVDEMYDLNKEIFKKFGLLDGPLPTLPEVISSFTSIELMVASYYQRPTLLLVPPNRSFDDLWAAIAKHLSPGAQRGPTISNTGAEEKKDKVFRAVITESTHNMMLFNNDSLAASLADRMQNIQATRYPGEQGMTRKIYALLAMYCMTKGQLIDTNDFAILDGEPKVAEQIIPVNPYIPIGHFVGDRPSFDWVPSKVEYPREGRFRRVAGGSQPIVPKMNIGLFRRHPDL